MELIREIEQQYRKPALPQVQTGDTVRVHQLIKEGNKQRIQVFEGVVIRRHRMNELTACITVRRIASGVGVEKTFLLHSPNVAKIEILRRAKVRRNFLSFLRGRRGKSARLREVAFDKAAANDVTAKAAPAADEAQDEEITEINEASSQDALDQAAPLDDETKAEGADAAAQDEPSVPEEGDESSDKDVTAEEFTEGIERAEAEEKQ